MSKKLCAILLCLSLSLSVFAGCSPQNTESAVSEKTSSAEASSSEQVSSAQSSESMASQSTDESAAANTEGKKELTILTSLLPAVQDMDTNKFTLKMEEQTGVHVTWQTIPQAAQGGTEKLALILSGGDYPDVYMNCPFTSDMVAKYGAGEGLLMPLDDYIGKITPNLDNVLKNVEKDGITLDSVRQMDGKVYAMPVFDTCQHCEYAMKMWYYLPWMEQFGYSEDKMPETTEEFYQLLKKIKETDINEDGTNDEIPLIGSAEGWNNRVEDFLINSFTYYKYDDNGMYLSDGKIMSSIDSEEFREGLKYVTKLYSEGLIYADSLTQDNATLVAITESEKPTVAFAAGGWTGMIASFGSDRANGFRAMKPLKGPGGVQTTPRFLQVPSGGNAAAYILSSTCKDPEAAVMYADAMYTKEMTLDRRGGTGLKGVGWDEALEGEKDFEGNPANWRMLAVWDDTTPQNESWLALGVWDYTTLRASQSIKEGLEMWSKDGLEWQLYDTTKNNYAPFKSETCEPLPPLNFTVEESEELGTIKTDLFTKSYFDQAKFDFISGAASLDNDWETYVKTLGDYGYTRMKEIYQAAYDRQYKK